MLNRLRNRFLLRWEWFDGSMNSLQADSLQACWRHMGVVGTGPENGSDLQCGRQRIINLIPAAPLESQLALFTNSAGAETMVLSRSLRTPDGLKAWSVDVQGLTTTQAVAYSGSSRTETTSYPDGTTASTVYSNGFAVAATPRNSTQPTRTAFDALGRVIQTVDPRTGASVFTYDLNNNLVMAIDTAGRTNRFTYDALNRQIAATAADGGVVSNVYYSTGALMLESGARTYPVVHIYDGLGRQTGLGTIRDPAMANCYRPQCRHTFPRIEIIAISVKWPHWHRVLWPNNREPIISL